MKITIKDVAKKAGVGTTTVSRVLNNEKYVSDEKRRLVEKAIRELGYSPNWIARSLVRKKTNLIGVIVPQVNLSFYSSILTVMEKIAFEHGYSLFICITMHNEQKEFQSVQLCKEMKVEGLILMHEQLAENTTKFIMDWGISAVSSSGEIYHTDIPSVLVDDYGASKELTHYVLEQGHRHLSYIAGSKEPHATLDKRLSGFLDAIAEAAQPITYEVVHGDYSIQSGYSLMESIISKNSPSTAVIAISDDVAIGAMNYLKDIGKKVPEDISVVGFDGSDISEHYRPRLTTIRQPFRIMGEETIKLIIQLINGEQTNEKVIVPYQLFIGNSVSQRKG